LIAQGKWAAIACDQFTSEPHYWEEADRLVGDAPSTLRMMLPEVYLSETDQRLPAIHAAMKEALSDHLVCHRGAMIAVERTQSDGRIRRGLVAQIDLEQYDYRKGSTALIRATEGTVLERIPPRVAVRRDAILEMPHVMLLIDDPGATVLEPLFEGGSPCKIAYDTDLMLGGGHIKGHFLTEEEQDRVLHALDALVTPEAMAARYSDASLAPLLFAVGDGNHSLATAKTIYEELKSELGEDEAACHPARYALVEIVNIHDDAMKFEPIYRVIFGVDPEDVITELKKYVSALSGNADAQDIEYLSASSCGHILVDKPEKTLTVATLQDFIDSYVKSHSSAEVDYIHGEGSVKSLIKEDSIGFLFSGMGKSEFFKTVIYDGALPRKTFSMGHAEDKRYYIECRKITK
jgi:hypothetical protein